MRRNWFWIIPAAIVGIALFTFLGGSAVMLLWNWLTPGLFGWHTLTFWQALALLALCRILFGGLGMHGGRGGGMGARMRARMRDRAEHLTDEERERMRERFGMGPRESGGQQL